MGQSVVTKNDGYRGCCMKGQSIMIKKAYTRHGAIKKVWLVMK